MSKSSWLLVIAIALNVVYFTTDSIKVKSICDVASVGLILYMVVTWNDNNSDEDGGKLIYN